MEEVVTSFIETAIVLGYLLTVLGGDRNLRKKRLAGALLVALVTCFLVIEGQNSTSKGILKMVLLMVYACTCFEGTRFEQIFYGASFALIAAISDQITFRVAHLLHIDNLEILISPGQVRYSMQLVYLLSCTLIVLFISLLRKKRMSLPFGFQLPLLAVFIGVLVGMDRLLDIMIFLDGLGNCESMVNLVKFICVLLPAIFFVTVFIVVRLAGIYQERDELKDRKRLDDLALKELTTIKESMAALRGWNHDMRSHLNTIYKLIEDGENFQAAEYITRIYGEMDSSIILVNSGNQILDAVISTKAMTAKNLGIRFHYKIHFEDEIPLTPSDITTLLGNILDNAIEACQEIEEGRERYISLEIKSVQKMIHMIADNACRCGIKPVNGEFPSTKGEGRGIGLNQVKRIAEKYGGFIHCEVEDACFRIGVYMPVSQEENG